VTSVYDRRTLLPSSEVAVDLRATVPSWRVRRRPGRAFLPSCPNLLPSAGVWARHLPLAKLHFALKKSAMPYENRASPDFPFSLPPPGGAVYSVTTWYEVV
jgi:hypothetical protein